MSVERPRVLVYRQDLLEASETFILSQGEALTGFEAWYCGWNRVAGLTVPRDRTLVLGAYSSRAERVRFLLGGHLSPDLKARVQKTNPVLVHAHFGPDGVQAMALARIARVPLIVSFHGYDATVRVTRLVHRAWPQRMYVVRWKRLCESISCALASSDFVLRKLIDRGIPRRKIRRHYIGVDTQYFAPSEMRRREPTVLFVGRLVAHKGCEFAIRAMTRVYADQARLVVIGDGPLRSDLESLARRLRVNVLFLGSLPPSEVKDWMDRASVFCGPSVPVASGAEEGLGMVFLEAQAMRLPVVGFATGGVPEAVATNETGYLERIGDWRGLAARMTLLLRDDMLRRTMGNAGRTRVESCFDLHHQTRILETVYEEIATR